MNRINALDTHVQLSEGNVAIQETFNNLQSKKKTTWKATTENLV